jgi:hypothetical protein
MATTPVLNTMVLDPVSGLLYAGADGQVLVLDPTTGANAGSWAVAGAVRRILPLYNR